jgi:hypothetical protein
MTVQVSAELLRRAADVLESGISDYAAGLAHDLKAAAGEALTERRETADLATLFAGAAA